MTRAICQATSASIRLLCLLPLLFLPLRLPANVLSQLYRRVGTASPPALAWLPQPSKDCGSAFVLIIRALRPRMSCGQCRRLAHERVAGHKHTCKPEHDI